MSTIPVISVRSQGEILVDEQLPIEFKGQDITQINHHFISLPHLAQQNFRVSYRI